MANFIAPLTPAGLLNATFTKTGQAATIGYATTAERVPGMIRIRHHGNAIADIHFTFDMDSQPVTTMLWVSNAGWGTVTTRDRINEVLRSNGVPFSVFQYRGEQVLAPRRGSKDADKWRTGFYAATFRKSNNEWVLTRFNGEVVA